MPELIAEMGMTALLACLAALIAGGVVKGVTAIGLPLVAVPVLATVLSVPQALSLIALPSAATSLWQALAGRRQREAIARLRYPILGLALGMSVSVRALASFDHRLLNLMLGSVVALFALVLLKRVVFTVAPRHEVWMGTITGVVAGLFGGISLFVGPIMAMFLSGLKLDKELFITTMAITNLSAAALFALLIAGHGIAGLREFGLSAAAALVVFVGLYWGQRLRARINDEAFRKALAVVLFLIAATLIYKGLAR